MKQVAHYQNIVVAGLGITGISVVKHLVKYAPNSQVRVIDTRAQPLGVELMPVSEKVALHCGGWSMGWLAEADLVVCNPGIALATPEIAQLQAKGIPIVGDIELFGWRVDKPVIAITGSNGKSTVTDLCGVLAKAAGINVGIGGNIGVPALDLLEQQHDLYILELSSFQLETTSTLALKVATFLNFSEDHMDRYAEIEQYRQAKLRIFHHAEFSLVNRDDHATYPDVKPENLLTFGLDNDQEKGELGKNYGIMLKNGVEYFCLAGQQSFAVNALSMVGRHNVANALVALALLDLAEVDTRLCGEALASYSGLSHRCQVVAECNGVKWVNDSKATNVASTLAALSGLNISNTLYLLVGGDGKGADFNELQLALSQLNVCLYCFGRDGRAFLPLTDQSHYFDSMDDAIANIKPQLVAGDMVMLSPACASFDQYPNFMQRGEAFIELAKRYA